MPTKLTAALKARIDDEALDLAQKRSSAKGTDFGTEMREARKEVRARYGVVEAAPRLDPDRYKAVLEEARALVDEGNRISASEIQRRLQARPTPIKIPLPSIYCLIKDGYSRIGLPPIEEVLAAELAVLDLADEARREEAREAADAQLATSMRQRMLAIRAGHDGLMTLFSVMFDKPGAGGHPGIIPVAKELLTGYLSDTRQEMPRMTSSEKLFRLRQLLGIAKEMDERLGRQAHIEQMILGRVNTMVQINQQVNNHLPPGPAGETPSAQREEEEAQLDILLRSIVRQAAKEEDVIDAQESPATG